MIYIFAIHPYFNILKNVIVDTIYRPPDENVTDFLNSLRKLLSTTTTENKICYVMGDFNLDLLRHEQHAITGEFVELMFSHLLYNMTTKSTRITSNTTSLINNIFTNNVTCLSVNGLIVNDLSDVLSIFSISRGDFDYGTSTKNRCRYFFVVFVFFCREIYQVNNYKRRAL